MFNYLIDLDGTIYRGQALIKYADEFINYLNDNNRKYLLVTNCPYNSAEGIANKLRQMGINSHSSNVLTSGMACCDYLLKNYKGASIFLIGSESLREEIESAGFKIVEANPDIVVVGYDRQFNYSKLEKACIYIRAGCDFVATNIDNTIPYQNTFIPHTGAIIAAITCATGIKPITIGKQEKYMLESAVKKLDCLESECAVIGDRLDTDIAFAVNSGITGYIVLTGTATMKQINSSVIKPDKIFNNLKEIIDMERSVSNVY